MDNFEEVHLLGSKKSSETGQNVDTPVRGQFSKTVIGEDLRRAIVALRSVPRVNWSQDSTNDDGNDRLASTEYIWRATDLSGCSSFAADWQTALRSNVCNQRPFLTNNGATKPVPSQMQNQSEIMRKDSFTIASKRLDRTSDSKCQLVEQSATAVQMSLFSRENRGQTNGSGEKSSISVPSELSASPADAAVPRKPPPLPPKPSHLYNLKIKQPVTGKLTLDEERLLAGAKYKRKSDANLNGTHQDIADIYERSLDILEKEDSEEEFEDLASSRSDSPERLLEELLNSVPAEEFDTLEYHTTSNASLGNNRGAVKTDSLNFDNLRSVTSGADDARSRDKKVREPIIHQKITAETDSSSRTEHFEQQRNHPSVKPVYLQTKLATRPLDFNAMKKSHSSQIECPLSSTLASDQLKVSSVVTASEKELTPEDIFEEIMDLLESSKDDHGERSNELRPGNESHRDQKHLQLMADSRWACDYSLENEWLSIYCDQIQPVTRHELVTKSGISERLSNTNTTDLISSKASTAEVIVKCKQAPGPLPGSNTALSSPDRKVLQSQNTTLLLPHGKTFQVPNSQLLSPEEKTLQCKYTALSSPDGKDLQGHNPHLSPTGRVTVTSQDTLQATVKKKPIPPLREKVQTYTFAKKESLAQDIKIAPTIKCQPLIQRNDPKMYSNGFSPLSNGPNSRSELKSEPVTAPYEYAENRAVDSSSKNVVLFENRRANAHTGGVTTKKESLLSPTTDRIVAVITRESERPGGDMCGEEEEEEMDLDLEIELSRNLDACTASDVECQSIDNLVTSESLFSSDTKVLRRPKKSSSLEVKAPGRLGEILAKKKLKKTQSIENTSEVVWSSRNEPVNSQHVDVHRNKTISSHGEDVNVVQVASHDLRVEKSQEFSDKRSTGPDNFETTRKMSPWYNNDSESLMYEASLDDSMTGEGTTRDAVADSSDSDNEDSYKQTMIRNVRSVEKENVTELDKNLPSIKVLSEEVTSQEIVLKIAWPKQESKGQRRITETKKPPFRELQLKRVMRISDLDNPMSVFPAVDASQPVLPLTQQSQNALRPELKPLTSSIRHPNVGWGITRTGKIESPVDQTVATRNISEISVEYVKQTNCRKLEHISDSAIDVQKSDTVKVLRVPMAAVHKVQDIKDAVAAVGSMILDDLQRQPKKRNIRVTCEAVESKSRASLHDQDVTVIRNTIVDTYAPKPAIVFTSRPANSVLI